MAWFRGQLSEAEQRIVNEEREPHPESHVRRRLLVLWSLQCGLKRAGGEIGRDGRATVGRYVAAHRDAIRESFAQQTTDEHDRRSVRADRATHGAAAAGADAGPPVPEGVGAEVAADAGDPGAPPKNWAKHVADQALFHDQPLQPRLDAALAGEGHVFFVDAAHFVFGAFLGGLWSFTRSFVRAASGRPRFHVLGRHPRTDRRDQHRGREHRDDVREHR